MVTQCTRNCSCHDENFGADATNSAKPEEWFIIFYKVKRSNFFTERIDFEGNDFVSLDGGFEHISNTK